MNKKTFQEICKGKYGRRVAYTDIDVIDETNVLDVLADTISIFHTNREQAKYLWDYKNGDQPTLYREKTLRSDVNNPVVENHAYEYVMFSVQQTYGEPVQYVSLRKDDAVNQSVEKLNEIMAHLSKAEKNISQGEWKSATGTSFLSLRRRIGDKDKPFIITVPTPLNTYVVYNSEDDEPRMSVQQRRDTKTRENYYYCHTANKIFKVKNGKLEPIGDNGEPYRLHVLGQVPVIEIPNNQDRLSDIELVCSLLDAVNNLESNRMDAVEQFVQSWIKFTNCEIEYEDLQKIKESGAIIVPPSEKGGNADVDFINQELNQSETQVAKEDLIDNALSILAIPSKQGNTGGDTQGAVELRNGWDFSKGRAKIKDAYVCSAEHRYAEMVLQVLRQSGMDLGIKSTDFEVHISHSPTDNLIIKSQALEYLLKNGIHPLVAIKSCGIWSDAEKTYLMSKPYLDNLYKEAKTEGVDLEEQKKMADAFISWLNAGLSPEEASKQVGLDVSTVANSPSINAKWNYE